MAFRTYQALLVFVFCALLCVPGLTMLLRPEVPRLYGVKPVGQTAVFEFPAEKPPKLEALVRGSDGAPYVLDSANATVWRIDIKKQKATAILKSGRPYSATYQPA